MHCRACNKLLSDYESTRKNAVTGQYLDLCKVCFEDVKPFVKVIDRKDLITEADLDDPEEDYDGDLDTGLSLEDLDIHINYEVDYEDSRGSYDV
jgi:hypothetical protein